MNSTTLPTTRLTLAAAALVAAATLALSGCSTPSSETSPTPSANASAESAAITLTDGWVKAVDGDMTGAFGHLQNSSDQDVTVVSASTPSADMVELHEVVDGKMQAKEGGFVIPARGGYDLEPGGDHIMLMALTGALEPGVNVELTITLDDGSTYDVTVPVKAYSGANENYAPGHGDGTETPADEHEGMDH
ncbi:copper chaperone PCu(A)C [Lysinibacter cavernae]|uniref:Copper chaperone PCu(A)C n=1 Tax=Lysinibacter cavernae TaxID=1640652 RepID=A0A7X5R101_9MICO|nr:copper chaperone PCu(A)C [Lysinibacter cavernae]NIH53390.1 hypothetical protein [Lysinibacter cavernae]